MWQELIPSSLSLKKTRDYLVHKTKNFKPPILSRARYLKNIRELNEEFNRLLHKLNLRNSAENEIFELTRETQTRLESFPLAQPEEQAEIMHSVYEALIRLKELIESTIELIDQYHAIKSRRLLFFKLILLSDDKLHLSDYALKNFLKTIDAISFPDRFIEYLPRILRFIKKSYDSFPPILIDNLIIIAQSEEECAIELLYHTGENQFGSLKFIIELNAARICATISRFLDGDAKDRKVYFHSPDSASVMGFSIFKTHVLDSEFVLLPKEKEINYITIQHHIDDSLSAEQLLSDAVRLFKQHAMIVEKLCYLKSLEQAFLGLDEHEIIIKMDYDERALLPTAIIYSNPNITAFPVIITANRIYFSANPMGEYQFSAGFDRAFIQGGNELILSSIPEKFPLLKLYPADSIFEQVSLYYQHLSEKKEEPFEFVDFLKFILVIELLSALEDKTLPKLPISASQLSDFCRFLHQPQLYEPIIHRIEPITARV